MAIWEQPHVMSGQPTQIPPQKPYLGIGMICQEYVTFQWAMMYALLQKPSPYSFLYNRNAPYDVAREQVARGLLQYDPEYIFFLDTDTCLEEPDGLLKLINLSKEYDKPLLSGLYYAKKKEEFAMPCAWLKTGENKTENTVQYQTFDIQPHLNKNALLQVNVAGAGCLLIKSEIFKKLDESNPKKPFFQWGVGRKDELTGKPLLQASEDFYFMERCANELGIYPHLATSVKCHHICLAQRRASDGKLEII